MEVLTSSLLLEKALGRLAYEGYDTAYAYKTNPYSIQNVGFVVAELLEIRMGEYLGDDDIILIEGQS